MLKWVKVNKIRQVSSIMISKSNGKGQKQPPEVFYEKKFFKNFTIFTGKHLCWSIFLVKMEACNVAKKILQRRFLPVNIS